jgi:uncharacterized protein
MQTVRDNFDASRFDAYVDGAVAGSLHYRIQDGQMWILGVVIDPEYQGPDLVQGLVGNALAQAHRRRLAVLPFCVEARRHVFAHPVYLKLVPQTERRRFSRSLTAAAGGRTRRSRTAAARMKAAA